MQSSRHLVNASMNATASVLFVIGGLIYWKELNATVTVLVFWRRYG